MNEGYDYAYIEMTGKGGGLSFVMSMPGVNFNIAQNTIVHDGANGLFIPGVHGDKDLWSRKQSGYIMRQHQDMRRLYDTICEVTANNGLFGGL